MNFRPRWFDLDELVPRETFELLGARAWELLDPRALATLDIIRETFGKTTVNNWRDGGDYSQSGWRPPASVVGAPLSQHRFGRAADVKCATATAAEVHAYIVANPAKFPELTTLEAIDATPTWVHFDVRNNAASGIRIVRP